MHLASMLEIVESGFADRQLLGSRQEPITGLALGEAAKRGAATLTGATAVVYVGENHWALPVALFSAAWAGVPFVPVNYRLEDDHLNALVRRQPGAKVIADQHTLGRLEQEFDATAIDDWVHQSAQVQPASEPDLDEDSVAIVLYTSGTTSEPKSALLRHRHLMAYLLGTIDFGSAADDEAVLIAVPPYHIAGMANLLSNLFAGRRLVYLHAFDPIEWLETVRRERVTNAMVVPTMLARIVDALGSGEAEVPTLRTLSYGGAKISAGVLRRALRAFPDTGFVNAYGLTETASSIAVLGPEDHRAAIDSDDPVLMRRLVSVGKVLPSVEIEIRDADDESLPPGSSGLICVRGEQVSGEYATGSVLDHNGWFHTRDQGWVDEDGYLYIEGRADDTIIRGGENIAPAEIEEVLLSDPSIADACVVGVPDEEWGQRIVAAVVPRPGSVVEVEALRSLVRSQLRSSKTPDEIVVRSDLPHTETGKLLRRVVLAELVPTTK